MVLPAPRRRAGLGWQRLERLLRSAGDVRCGAAAGRVGGQGRSGAQALAEGGSAMTGPREKRWFLDLAHTCDEVLLLFAQAARSQPARDELTCRHWRQFKARFPRCGIRLRLT